jgi:hypothetical protein
MTTTETTKTPAPEGLTMSFYVSIRRATANGGYQSGLLAGPFDTHGEALAMVPAATRAATEVDPRAHWDLFGTCRARSIYGVGQPVGRLNAKLGLPTSTDTTIATVESEWTPVDQPAVERRVNVAGQQGTRRYLADRDVAFDVGNPTLTEVQAEIDRLTAPHGRHKGHKGCAEAAALLASLASLASLNN